MSIQKVGLVGFIAAVLLAFGAFGLQTSEKTEAAATSNTCVDQDPSVAGIQVEVGVPTTCTVTLTDDELATDLTILGSNVGNGMVLSSVVGYTAAGTAGPGTTGVVDSDPLINSITVLAADLVDSDSDGAIEAITISYTYNCAGSGPGNTVTATQGAAFIATIDCLEEVAGDVANLDVEVENFGAADVALLETFSVCPRFGAGATNELVRCASPNAVGISLHATDDDGDDVPGAQILALATTGFLQASSDPSDCLVDDDDVNGADPDDDNALQEEDLTDADGESEFIFCVFAGNTLGPTTITFIAVSDLDGVLDVIETVSFTIVGPPASLTISAAPTTLVCGEKATITGTVKDAIGQNVSTGTIVELITNFGGIAIGSTGTGIGNFGGVQAGATATVSNGAFTGFLLTSTTHVGSYEVVAAVDTTGPTLFQQTTVTCTAAAGVAPSVTAPNTGTGNISPPNTGDAGLAAASSSNASLFVLFGAVAFVLAGFASFGFARR